jgi:hypothetical protein
MFMLGVGARRGAAITGTIAILFALCAFPFPLALGSFFLLGYSLWLASMVLVVYGALRDGRYLPKQKLDKLLDLYEGDP